MLVYRGCGLIFALVSSCFARRSRVIFLYEGLSQAPTSLDAETVHDIFVPVLPERGVKSVSEFFMTEGRYFMEYFSCCMYHGHGVGRVFVFVSLKSSIALKNGSLSKLIISSLFRGRLGEFKVLHGSSDRHCRCVWFAISPSWIR